MSNLPATCSTSSHHPVTAPLFTPVPNPATGDATYDVKAAAGKILGAAMEKKRDVDLLGQLSDGTTDLGGSADLTMGFVAAARALLAGNATTSGGPAPLPYVLVHHPFVFNCSRLHLLHLAN